MITNIDLDGNPLRIDKLTRKLVESIILTTLLNEKKNYFSENNWSIIPVIDSIITDKNTFSGFPEAGRGIAVSPFPSFKI